MTQVEQDDYRARLIAAGCDDETADEMLRREIERRASADLTGRLCAALERAFAAAAA